MYEGKSKLCSSYAWDTALKFIDGENGIWSVNSEGGNYYTSTSKLKNTGYHKMKNIYDMGGNVYEWTTEAYTDVSGLSVCRRWLLQQCVYRHFSWIPLLQCYKWYWRQPWLEDHFIYVDLSPNTDK